MAAEDHLNPTQFRDVYHSTDPNRAKAIVASGKFKGDSADNFTFVSTVRKSRYLDEFGSHRIHLQVPEHMLQEDPGAEGDYYAFEHMWGKNEEHYAINAADIKPEHIKGGIGLNMFGKINERY